MLCTCERWHNSYDHCSWGLMAWLAEMLFPLKRPLGKESEGRRPWCFPRIWKMFLRGLCLFHFIQGPDLFRGAWTSKELLVTCLETTGSSRHDHHSTHHCNAAHRVCGFESASRFCEFQGFSLTNHNAQKASLYQCSNPCGIWPNICIQNVKPYQTTLPFGSSLFPQSSESSNWQRLSGGLWSPVASLLWPVAQASADPQGLPDFSGDQRSRGGEGPWSSLYFWQMKRKPQGTFREKGLITKAKHTGPMKVTWHATPLGLERCPFLFLCQLAASSSLGWSIFMRFSKSVLLGVVYGVPRNFCSPTSLQVSRLTEAAEREEMTALRSWNVTPLRSHLYIVASTWNQTDPPKITVFQSLESS